MKLTRLCCLVPVLLALMVFASGCAGRVQDAASLTELAGVEVMADLLSGESTVDGVGAVGEAVTPYQQQLARTLQERSAAGLPTPSSVTFEYELKPPQAMVDSAEHIVQITAKTILHFDGPEEAGYDVWPALVVTGTLPAGAHGSVLAGDYTELYRTLLAEQMPDIWEQIEFGQEPRTHTISETLDVSVPSEAAPIALALNAEDADVVQAVLMGLTYTGPQIDYTIGDTLTVRDFTIYDYVAGLTLDWSLGLRLPADVALSALPAEASTAGFFETAILPADWSAQAYEAAGVSPQEGNEFLLRLDAFAGIKAILLEINVCPVCYVETRVDESASFATPFGPDAYLPIPQIAMPIWNGGLGFAAADVGLVVIPRIGSTQITADWQTRSGSDCAHSGQVTYVAPAMPVAFGPETSCETDADGESNVELTEFRYWLDQFRLGLNVNMDIGLFGYDLWSGTPLPIEVNLSPLSQFVSLGAHQECDWRFRCEPTGSVDGIRLSYTEE